MSICHLALSEIICNTTMHLNLLLMCDMDDNWVMLLFTLCTHLILKYMLVGGMGTSEVGPSNFQHIQ